MMRIGKRLLSAILAVSLLCGTAVFGQAEERIMIRADFSHLSGIPLFKRQNTFSVSYSFGLGGDSSAYLEAVSTLRELRSENMRVDLSMGNGGLGKYFAQGSRDNMTNQYTALDLLLKKLYENGTQPYFSYGYMPALLQSENGTWRSAPEDMELWRQLCADISAHYAEKGWPLAAHEIWNEPDLTDGSGKHVFYSGTWEEFIEMYGYGAQGIREGNPYASVGGMSIAFPEYMDGDKMYAFLDAVDRNGWPMDFISFHNYGTLRYIANVKTMNGLLSSFGDAFDTVGLHINEFHVREAGADGKWKTEESSGFNSAVLAAEAIRNLVEMPTVTSVNWATWRDNGEGLNMVDNKTGERSALFHVLALYNRLPVCRAELTESKYIKGLAGMDEDRAGILLYTKAVKTQSFTVALDDLPFDRADIRLYTMDVDHPGIYNGSDTDELYQLLELTDVSTEDLALDLELAGKGIIYIEAIRAGGTYEPAAVWSMQDGVPVSGETAKVLKKDYYFENRDSTLYSEFDLGNFSAWAGMGSEETGTARGSVVLDNLPEALFVTPVLYNGGENTVCTLTAEYLDDAGNCTESRTFEIRSSAGCESFILARPEGFEGVLKLTYSMTDGGANAAIQWKISK